MHKKSSAMKWRTRIQSAMVTSFALSQDSPQNWVSHGGASRLLWNLAGFERAAANPKWICSVPVAKPFQ
jgi:hypothetical protein